MANVLGAVMRAMERIAPLRLAESWDNVGLLVEVPHELFPRARVQNVLLTIDVTPSVLHEALNMMPPPTMIVSYHPPIFHALKRLTLANPLQSSLLRCIAQGISIYSPHTALDSTAGGINDWVASGLGEAEVKPLSPSPDDPLVGSGRLVTFQKALPISELVARVKQHLGLERVQLAQASSDQVTTVAICAGSGGSVLGGVKCGAFLTGEMQHHEVLAANASGTHVILCGHTNTERGYLPLLQQRLAQLLAQDAQISSTDTVKVLISNEDRHPLSIV